MWSAQGVALVVRVLVPGPAQASFARNTRRARCGRTADWCLMWIPGRVGVRANATRTGVGIDSGPGVRVYTAVLIKGEPLLGLGVERLGEALVKEVGR
jgi:hypothetical protein